MKIKCMAIIFIIALCIGGCGNDQAKENETYNNNTETTATPTPTKKPTPTTEPTPTPEPTPFDNMTLYEEGQYKVGADIPSGEYVILAGSAGGYFSVTSDANGSDILFNDNFDTNSIITVYDGEFLELSRCFAVSTEEFYSEYVVDLDNTGIFIKVGIDIPAGEYKLESDANGGYYCIYSSSRHDDIIANDNFKGNSYININDGEYLVLSRCKLIR